MDVESTLDINLAIDTEDEVDGEDGAEKQLIAQRDANQRFGLVNVERVCVAGRQHGVNLHVDLQVSQVHVDVVLWKVQVEIKVNVGRLESLEVFKHVLDVDGVVADIVRDVAGDFAGVGGDVVPSVFEAVFDLVDCRGDVERAFGGDLCAGLALDVAFRAYDFDVWLIIEKGTWNLSEANSL